jgi:AmmeMemoRadiSam system protein A
MLTETEKKILLQTARQSITSAVNNLPLPVTNNCSDELLKQCGAFVTLFRENELRGCIGFIDARRPLIETIREAAERAALEDPRFAPVASDELEQIDIEISVLSVLKRLEQITEINIGTDGIVVELGMKRGLLLPQVAKENGWNHELFFKQTLRKAGIPVSLQVHPELRAFTFTAEVFNEHELFVTHS